MEILLGHPDKPKEQVSISSSGLLYLDVYGSDSEMHSRNTIHENDLMKVLNNYFKDGWRVCRKG